MPVRLPALGIERTLVVVLEPAIRVGLGLAGSETAGQDVTGTAVRRVGLVIVNQHVPSQYESEIS
jgi:hypothetical protein